MAKSKKSRFSKNKEALKERARNASRTSSGGGLSRIFQNIKNLPVWEPREVGEYTLSILPYEQTSEYNPDFAGETINVEEGLLWWRRIFGLHWVNGKPHICPKMTFGKNCPICDSETEVWDAWKEAGKPKGDAGKPFFDKINKEIRPQELVAMVADVTDDKEKTERKLFVSKYSKYNKHIDYIMDAMSGKAPTGKNDDEKKANQKNYATIKKKYNTDNFNGKDIELFYYFDERFNLIFDVELCGTDSYAHKALANWKNLDFVEAEDISEDIVDEIPKLDEIFVEEDYATLKEIWENGEDDSDDTSEYTEEVDNASKTSSKAKRVQRNKKTEETVVEPSTEDSDDDWGDDTSDNTEDTSDNVEESTDGDDDDWGDWD